VDIFSSDFYSDFGAIFSVTCYSNTIQFYAYKAKNNLLEEYIIRKKLAN